MTDDPDYEPVFGCYDDTSPAIHTSWLDGLELYYNRRSQPISYLEYAQTWLGDFDRERRIGGTRVAGCWVSTVWLGVNHAWNPGQVLIFETMVVNRIKRKDNRPWCPGFWVARYRYENQAKLGHERVVNRLRSRGWASLHDYWHDDFSDGSEHNE